MSSIRHTSTLSGQRRQMVVAGRNIPSMLGAIRALESSRFDRTCMFSSLWCRTPESRSTFLANVFISSPILSIDGERFSLFSFTTQNQQHKRFSSIYSPHGIPLKVILHENKKKNRTTFMAHRYLHIYANPFVIQ